MVCKKKWCCGCGCTVVPVMFSAMHGQTSVHRHHNSNHCRRPTAPSDIYRLFNPPSISICLPALCCTLSLVSKCLFLLLLLIALQVSWQLLLSAGDGED